MALTTLRALLTQAGFDWEHGAIVLQPVTSTGEPPGLADADGLGRVRQISPQHSDLDAAFQTGYSAFGCPVFAAHDREWVYFPVQYDGATWVGAVRRNVLTYAPTDRLPYHGG